MMKYPILIFCLFFLGCSLKKDDKKEIKYSASDLVIKYHPDSVISSMGNFVNGKKEGVWRYYNKYSELLREIEYSNDVIDGMLLEYRHGRLLWSEHFTKGKRNGLAKYYNIYCGTVEEEGYYFDDKASGLWYNYFNGILLKVERFENGDMIDLLYENDDMTISERAERKSTMACIPEEKESH